MKIISENQFNIRIGLGTQQPLKVKNPYTYYSARLRKYLGMPDNYEMILELIGKTEKNIIRQFGQENIIETGNFEDFINYIKLSSENDIIICAFNMQGVCCRTFLFKNQRFVKS